VVVEWGGDATGARETERCAAAAALTTGLLHFAALEVLLPEDDRTSQARVCERSLFDRRV
jgi:hypothetical protein